MLNDIIEFESKLIIDRCAIVLMLYNCDNLN